MHFELLGPNARIARKKTWTKEGGQTRRHDERQETVQKKSKLN
jgi:hypothetical protein